MCPCISEGEAFVPEHGEQEPLDPIRSFELLYEQWSGPIYRYLARLAGPGKPAEDLFQDTWLKVIEHRGQLRDSRRFAPWLYRIARNLAFNEAREGRRKTRVWNMSSLNAKDGALLERLPERPSHEAPRPLARAIDNQR